MAQAIAYMRQHHRHQPDLKTLAQQANLSEGHFQRQFRAWAGISPKRFCQYLTVEYAKAHITEADSLLDLSLATGLSGPGRLHDLFVTLEAMSPGEYKQGGAGLTIRYGTHPTPFGPCLVAMTARGVCHLQFLDEEAETATLQAAWPRAELVEDREATAPAVEQIFDPANSQNLILHLRGTNFQIQVWRALLRIPFGSLTTYQHLAQALGKPTAARAVGNAVGNNPVGYLIPCHRVIRGSGELGGYRWGLDRKAALIGWEAARCDAETDEPQEAT